MKSVLNLVTVIVYVALSNGLLYVVEGIPSSSLEEGLSSVIGSIGLLLMAAGTYQLLPFAPRGLCSTWGLCGLMGALFIYSRSIIDYGWLGICVMPFGEFVGGIIGMLLCVSLGFWGIRILKWLYLKGKWLGLLLALSLELWAITTVIKACFDFDYEVASSDFPSSSEETSRNALLFEKDVHIEESIQAQKILKVDSAWIEKRHNKYTPFFVWWRTETPRKGYRFIIRTISESLPEGSYLELADGGYSFNRYDREFYFDFDLKGFEADRIGAERTLRINLCHSNKIEKEDFLVLTW